MPSGLAASVCIDLGAPLICLWKETKIVLNLERSARRKIHETTSAKRIQKEICKERDSGDVSGQHSWRIGTDLHCNVRPWGQEPGVWTSLVARRCPYAAVQLGEDCYPQE